MTLPRHDTQPALSPLDARPVSSACGEIPGQQEASVHSRGGGGGALDRAGGALPHTREGGQSPGARGRHFGQAGPPAGGVEGTGPWGSG